MLRINLKVNIYGSCKSWSIGRHDINPKHLQYLLNTTRWTTLFCRRQNIPLHPLYTCLHLSCLWKPRKRHQRCISTFHALVSSINALHYSLPWPDVWETAWQQLHFLQSSRRCRALSTILPLTSVTCCHNLRFLLFQMLRVIVTSNSDCIAVPCSKRWNIISYASSYLCSSGSITCHSPTSR
jgi:hypothetical protein